MANQQRNQGNILLKDQPMQMRAADTRTNTFGGL